MEYKAISEFFFTNAIKEDTKNKIFLSLEDECFTYLQIKNLCMRFISYILNKNFLNKNFYILSSSPKAIIISFLALNYINKNVHIISENILPLVFSNKKNNSDNIFIVDKDIKNDFILSQKNINILDFNIFIAQNKSKVNYQKFINNIKIRNSSLIQYTSGTNGNPSCITRSKESLYIEALDLINIWKIDSSSKIACFTPFSYSFAFGNVIVTSIISSASIITCKKINITKILEILKNNQATHFITVVSVIKLLLLQPNKTDLSFLKYLICSGSKLNKTDERKSYKKFKIHISEQYGMTETGALFYSYVSNSFFINFPSICYRVKDGILYVLRKGSKLPELKTNDLVIFSKKKGIKIIGRADSILKLDDKRYSIEYIISLFENRNYIDIAKKIISNKKLNLQYTNENKSLIKETVVKLKKMNPSIKIKLHRKKLCKDL